MRNVSILLLGILGGLLGILIGAGELLSVIIFWGHLPGSWAGLGLISPEIEAILFILLGMIGTIAALSYSEGRKRTAQAILISGLSGFLIGFVSGSYLMGGWIYWLIPGALLTTAGYIALVTPEKIASSLPLVRSDKREIRFMGYALYSGLFIGGLILVMAALILTSMPGDGPEADASEDESDFENAEFAQGMGRLNDSLKSYDDILERNQSNVRAWMDKGDVLTRLGRYEEALACYDKVQEIDPASPGTMYARKDVLRRLSSRNETEDQSEYPNQKELPKF